MPRAAKRAGRALIVVSGALWLAASCGATRAAGVPPVEVTAAVAHPDRSGADRRRDQTSRPEAVLGFLGLAPGMVAFDALAGNGYYSELMARVVGQRGKVYLHNNQAYLGLMHRQPRRLEDLPQLELYVREIADINLASDSVDLVLMVKVYHDLYYLNNGWRVPPGPLFDTLWRILKPGAALGVIDHAALPVTGSSSAQNLHRINPEFAIADIESRGFRFVGSTDVLLNPEDDLNRSAFHPEIRGQTSRFVHKYVKIAR